MYSEDSSKFGTDFCLFALRLQSICAEYKPIARFTIEEHVCMNDIFWQGVERPILHLHLHFHCSFSTGPLCPSSSLRRSNNSKLSKLCHSESPSVVVTAIFYVCEKFLHFASKTIASRTSIAIAATSGHQWIYLFCNFQIHLFCKTKTICSITLSLLLLLLLLSFNAILVQFRFSKFPFLRFYLFPSFVLFITNVISSMVFMHLCYKHRKLSLIFEIRNSHPYNGVE